MALLDETKMNLKFWHRPMFHVLFVMTSHSSSALSGAVLGSASWKHAAWKHGMLVPGQCKQHPGSTALHIAPYANSALQLHAQVVFTHEYHTFTVR